MSPRTPAGTSTPALAPSACPRCGSRWFQLDDDLDVTCVICGERTTNRIHEQTERKRRELRELQAAQEALHPSTPRRGRPPRDPAHAAHDPAPTSTVPPPAAKTKPKPKRPGKPYVPGPLKPMMPLPKPAPRTKLRELVESWVA